MSAIEERRQRAWGALFDARDSIRELPAAVDPVEVAIKTATRVQISPDLIRAAQNATECDPAECDPCIEAAVRAAFTAAGFEVVE